jgi:glutathione peroxidase-family protein
VSFRIFGKTNVNGSAASPLYEWMKAQKPGLLGLKLVKWNFEKFLVGSDGQVKGRWGSRTEPAALEKPILEALAAKSEL